MALEHFQQATVDAAIRALTNPIGSQRFLIADEVGLGKTISSKSIAVAMREGMRRPLNVIYLCPNLSIASQNLKKLNKLEPTWKQPEDRLSLVCRDRNSTTAHHFRLFCYTPETSLPGWKAALRTGRVAERALIASLIAHLAPSFWERLMEVEEQRRKPRAKPLFALPGDAPKHLIVPFTSALRRVLSLQGRPLAAGLGTWLDQYEDVPEFILRARSALALVALTEPATRPDLLILDEFHRYADLILPRPLSSAPSPMVAERQAIHRILVDALLGAGPSRPKLLLMSATPYRLHRLDGSEVEGGEYSNFISLVRFLYGDEGSAEAEKTKALIAAHHRALQAREEKDTALGAIAHAKLALEKSLRPVIARTERATSVEGELFHRRTHPANIEGDDLRIFQHFAKAIDARVPDMRGWVTPLWLSVPYPAEMLFDYKVCKGLKDLPTITAQQSKGRAAHPRLRALLEPAMTLVEPIEPLAEPVDPEFLSLPWSPPTLPWWRLGGKWAEQTQPGKVAGKALIFSRYKATPASVSAYLSEDADRRSSHKMKGKGKFSAQAYLRFEKKSPWPLICLFMPWPHLSRSIELSKAPNQPLAAVKRDAFASLERWFKANGFSIAEKAIALRKPWRLALDVEATLGGTAMIEHGFKEVAALGKTKRKEWRPARKSTHVSRDELRQLAEWLLSAPGAVIGRSLQRHQPDIFEDNDEFRRAFRFCWGQLRPYLGQRYFAGAILRTRRARQGGGYPEALRRAIYEGGFESVVDEHLAVMSLVGDDTPIEFLEASLLGRPGRVQRRKSRGVGRARVHAAVPFSGAERRTAKSKTDQKMRSDSLRQAFNSPFWPHVLTTTSIGQEGLDFHVWCDRIVHWDLPRDPVDFEQREGRISRYASLAVRRALAADFRHAADTAKPGQSPFGAIFDAARAAPSVGLGLERWWSPTNHRPISVTFAMPFSLGTARLEDLRSELLRYRLALGQPEPALFEAMVHHFNLEQGEARRLALNLSAAAE